GNPLEEGESDRILSEEERSKEGRTSGENGASSEADGAESEETEKAATPA
nr:hypothetical protein [Thermoleophilaceae bacterium]